MNSHDLTRLGDKRFEQLIQALSLRHIGPGVNIFGDGPDGGREATFSGEIHLTGKAVWNGYGVIQAKYKETLSIRAADQKWFLQQVTAELNAWLNPKTRRANRPNYIILVTNVTLSAVAENGGLDKLDAIITDFRERIDEKTKAKIGLPELRDYHIWHADYLDRLLDDNVEISRRYADLVLPGDVLSRLYDQLTQDDQRIAAAWINHVTQALETDIKVELAESGDLTNTRLELADIAVDLPAHWPQSDPRKRPIKLGALHAVIERADQVLAPELHPAARDRVVVLGGPGSGKSTISRLLCQIYRAALVGDTASERVTPQTAERAARLREAFTDAQLPTPTLHRIPVRVVLSTFADQVSKPAKPTLLQHIVEIVNSRSSDSITVPQAIALFKSWPLLLVLDGLDEVASATNRDEVNTRIGDFFGEMAAMHVDVLTVCTSRPIGFDYDHRLDYEELRLTPLTPQEAVNYGSRLLRTRFMDSPERHEEIAERLLKASRNNDTARLMTSPLQVTILSLLLEQSAKVPDSKYALFGNYYDVIFARESNKPQGIGDVVRLYRPQLDQLHQRCGLAIHARAEHAGDADSILPIEELRTVARAILDEEEQNNPDLVIDQIVHLTRQRLVLLVPRGDGVAFEVRSLAEYFAARGLMSQENDFEALEKLVPSAHWRHTWLLAAGYVFADRLGQRGRLLEVLEESNHQDSLTRFVMPGSTLAIDALKDGFAANTPKFQKRLIRTALLLVSGPRGSHISALAGTLAPLMEADEVLNQTVWQEIGALIADHNQGAIRIFLQGLASTDSGHVAAYATRKLEQYLDSSASSGSPRQVSDYETYLAIQTCMDESIEVVDYLATLTGPDIRLTDLPRKERIEFLAGLSHAEDATAGATLRSVRICIVDNCLNNDVRRAKFRARLALAVEHDYVGNACGDS